MIPTNQIWAVDVFHHASRRGKKRKNEKKKKERKKKSLFCDVIASVLYMASERYHEPN